MSLLCKNKGWVMAGPAWRSCLSSLIPCRKCDQGYDCGQSFRGWEQPSECFIFRNDEIGSSHMIYRLLFFFFFSLFSFFSNILEGDNTSNSDIAAVWSNMCDTMARKGEEGIGRTKKHEPHRVVFQAVWWWQEYSYVWSSQMENCA